MHVSFTYNQGAPEPKMSRFLNVSVSETAVCPPNLFSPSSWIMALLDFSWAQLKSRRWIMAIPNKLHLQQLYGLEI